MREIKFRGKDKSNGRWHYGLLEIPLTNRKVSRHYILGYNYSQYGKDEVHAESVGQYTGLKDKNGVEIYEGDIIRSGKESPIGTVVTAKVYWKGAGFALLTTRGSDTTSAYLELLSPFCEVIGNVHEHPHLLKGE